MAASKKKVKQKEFPIGKQIIQKENPDEFYSRTPSWIFNSCDTEHWTLSQDLGDLFWEEILPFLKCIEQKTWQEILAASNNNNHFIAVGSLNKCAKERLEELHIEHDSILSLRIQSRHRIYGYHGKNGSFCILWLDLGHGDNETCVCRSRLKHT